MSFEDPAIRLRRIQKQREQEHAVFQKAVSKMKEQLVVKPITEKFASKVSTEDDLLRQETIGLQSLSDFRKKRQRIESGVVVDMEDNRDNKRNKTSHTTERSRLSFNLDDEEQDQEEQEEQDHQKQEGNKENQKENEIGKEKDNRKGNGNGNDDEKDNGKRNSNDNDNEKDGKGNSNGNDNEKDNGNDNDNDNEKDNGKGNGNDTEKEKEKGKRRLVYTKLGKDPTIDTSFLPDKSRDEFLEQQKRRFQIEWLQQQEEIKEAPFSIDYCFYDGTSYKKNMVIKKGYSIKEFLTIAKKQFPDIQDASTDQLLFIKENVILPHHYTFYELIEAKAGKSGSFENWCQPESSSNPSPTTPILSSRSSALTHTAKIVEKTFYDRNKHLYPFNLWEVFTEKPTIN